MNWKYPLTNYVYRRISKPLAEFFDKINATPTQVTILSVTLGVLSGFILYTREFFLGIVLLFISQILDCVDGDLARLQGTTSKRGAFISSFLDRIVEIAVIYGIILTNPTQLLLVGSFALVSSIMVTYARREADRAGVECKVGLASRDIRIFVIMVSIFLYPFLPSALYWGFVVLIILSSVSVVQRFYHTYTRIKF
jgi:CDP-diacylglycerol--glycerol-3-phosphate 3-phosphatidyltransferase